MQNLPSWVPDWTVRNTTTRIPPQISASHTNCSTRSAGLAAFPWFSTNVTALDLRNQIHKAEINICEVPPLLVVGKVVQHVILRDLRSWDRSVYVPKSNWDFPLDASSNSFDFAKRFWTSIKLDLDWNNPKTKYCLGIPPVFGPKRTSSKTKETANGSLLDLSFPRRASRLSSSNEDLLSRFTEARLSLFTETSRGLHHGRVFFGTTDSVGFGPASMQSGDEVWLLEGQRVPYVLRAYYTGNYIIDGREREPRSYQVLGTCYLFAFSSISSESHSLSHFEGILLV